MQMKNKKYISIVTIILFFILFIILYWSYFFYKNIDIKNEENYIAEKTNFSTNNLENVENLSQNKTSIVNMLENLTKSVVGISKLKDTGGSIFNNISSDELGLGTGIIITENGYILSNSHVTGEKYSTCFVTIDEKDYNGKVVWSDLNLDLSIVKIGARNLKYVTFGDSKSLKVGEQVYAIGNPIGYEFRKTVTSGIISALNRTIKIDEDETTSYISNLIQTDATINPGNSGGPLINTKGEVIGINTVKITSAEGIGFAIPINVIKPVVESFIKTGDFEEATLGIYAYDTDVAEYLKLKNKKIEGIYISKITINGPADNKGLKEGDLITKISGIDLKTMDDLRTFIYSKKPGDIVTLNILRDSKNKEINITLGKK